MFCNSNNKVFLSRSNATENGELLLLPLNYYCSTIILPEHHRSAPLLLTQYCNLTPAFEIFPLRNQSEPPSTLRDLSESVSPPPCLSPGRTTVSSQFCFPCHHRHRSLFTACTMIHTHLRGRTGQIPTPPLMFHVLWLWPRRPSGHSIKIKNAKRKKYFTTQADDTIDSISTQEVTEERD